MTTLDHIPARAASWADLRAAALVATTVILLLTAGIALVAPEARVSDDWHGNVAKSAPR